MCIGTAFLINQNKMKIKTNYVTYCHIFLEKKFHPNLHDVNSENNVLLFKIIQKHFYPTFFVWEN